MPRALGSDGCVAVLLPRLTCLSPFVYGNAGHAAPAAAATTAAAIPAHVAGLLLHLLLYHYTVLHSTYPIPTCQFSCIYGCFCGVIHIICVSSSSRASTVTTAACACAASAGGRKQLLLLYIVATALYYTAAGHAALTAAPVALCWGVKPLLSVAAAVAGAAASSAPATAAWP
eukprot:GHRR01013909.1.p2 GENE.GHRR01013909.1~~GHRR01013909.1.p2  ORF type:complete len:173 (-),score=67.33 GHRR01013909.1:882-1400(-)